MQSKAVLVRLLFVFFWLLGPLKGSRVKGTAWGERCRLLIMPREKKRHHRLLVGRREEQKVVMGARVVRDDVMRKDRRAARLVSASMDRWNNKTEDRLW